MADWREVATTEGWTVFSKSVRIRLGGRKHTIQVHDLGAELEFYAALPETDTAQLVDLLVMNRSTGLAYWHIDGGYPWAVSRCPRSARASEMAEYMRETAALADRMELRLSDLDL